MEKKCCPSYLEFTFRHKLSMPGSTINFGYISNIIIITLLPVGNHSGSSFGGGRKGLFFSSFSCFKNSICALNTEIKLMVLV